MMVMILLINIIYMLKRSKWSKILISYLKNMKRSQKYEDSKAFIEYSNNMQDVYKNIEEYNPDKKHKVLIVFDDMIADMISNKKT